MRSNSGALIGKLRSNGSGPGNLAAGQPATAEVDALAVPAWRKTILHAMRTYGMYFGDTRGPSSFGVMMESGATYTGFGAPNRMVEFARTNGWTDYDGYYVGKLRDGVPWNRLRVLDWSDPANR